MAMRRLSPPSRPGRSLASLTTDRRGAAAIEFALCGSAFLALLIAILSTGLTLFAQQALQTVADDIARQVLTGRTAVAGVDADGFRRQACARLPAFLSCSRLMVDLRRADAFADADTGTPTLSFDDTGQVTNSWRFERVAPGDVVVLRILYRWPVPGGPLGVSLANSGDGQRLLVGTQLFKAEPFA